MKLYELCTRKRLCLRSSNLLLQKNSLNDLKDASAGNRTLATLVAGENSTTEPPMLAVYKRKKQLQRLKRCIGRESTPATRVAGETSTTEPPMSAVHKQQIQI